jgi:hypothetical protein
LYHKMGAKGFISDSLSENLAESQLLKCEWWYPIVWIVYKIGITGLTNTIPTIPVSLDIKVLDENTWLKVSFDFEMGLLMPSLQIE